jgi:hypothetical protein
VVDGVAAEVVKSAVVAGGGEVDANRSISRSMIAKRPIHGQDLTSQKRCACV